MKQLLIFIFTLTVLAPVTAQNEKSSRNKDFDFWLGEWTIYYTGTTMAAGNATISLTSDDSIQEQYSAISGGYQGVSITVYDAEEEEWIQNFSDTENQSFVIKGKFKNNKMKLQTKDDDGVKNKITWEPQDDGTIRQIWEQKQDKNKAKWEVVFDGIYRRKPTQ